MRKRKKRAIKLNKSRKQSVNAFGEHYCQNKRVDGFESSQEGMVDGSWNTLTFGMPAVASSLLLRDLFSKPSP